MAFYVNMGKKWLLRLCRRRGQVWSLSVRCKANETSLAAAAEEEEEEVVKYPPVKPRWPPGGWGRMNEKLAWRIHDRGVEMSDLPTPSDRIRKLGEKPQKIWQFPAVQRFPKTFDYQRYITKTHLVSGVPGVYADLEELATEKLSRVRPLVLDAILAEQERADRIQYQKKSFFPADKRENILKIGHIVHALLTSLADEDSAHLLKCQFDENVTVKAFWERHGVPYRYVESEQDLPWYIPNFTGFQTTYMADYQIRSDVPLQQFVPKDSQICTEGFYPEFNYWPKVIGQNRQVMKPECVAGFWLGDPCEYGVLSFISNSEMKWLRKKFCSDMSDEIQKGYGLVASFAWLVAQAYYQGFNTYQDITYPFTTQTVVTDGQSFSFFSYQLNTLLLWKDDLANPLRNICWHLDCGKLFETIENGEVKGFNDDVLKQLIKYMINKPVDPGFNLCPTGVVEHKQVTEYISFKSEAASVK